MVSRRDKDRKKAGSYFLYLRRLEMEDLKPRRLFLTAMSKLPTSKKELYRGVARRNLSLYASVHLSNKRSMPIGLAQKLHENRGKLLSP